MTTGRQDRQYWVATLDRIAHPVFTALAHRQLKASMPVETVGASRSRDHVSHLEALGRTLAGVAPWFEATGLAPDEAARRDDLLALARESLYAACDPASPDALNFSIYRQPLVDAAFLAHGLLRAPCALWEALDSTTQTMVIDALTQVRGIMPHWNNWLLFAAMIETFLQRATGHGDLLRIDYALRQHEQWYKGDGLYGDGPYFHWDYYNSYVIHPMLLDIARAIGDHYPEASATLPTLLDRARRYAVIQERLIAPDGTFPVIGRSITYRAGAFQTLAHVALWDSLPDDLPPAQARCALTAVIHRMMDAPGTFDEAGWLRIGLAGHQPGLAESYISTGSLYLCTVAFLPLGLSPTHPFWSGEPQPWTSQRAWSGADIPRDGAMDDFKNR